MLNFFNYFTFIMNCPGIISRIIPPMAHISMLSLTRIGFCLTKTVGRVGIHIPAGANVQTGTGIHAATFNWHVPNGTIFIPGTQSKIVPAGNFDVVTIFTGKQQNGVGAAPNVHWHNAPLQTTNGIKE